MHEIVKNYYGHELQGSGDLRTDACCTDEDLPAYLKPLLARVHREVLQRYYGCGLIAPTSLRDARVLDLGCGSGRDCYVLAQLVGPAGKVVGVDMTPEQLELARRYEDYHRDQFGFEQSNVQFFEGYIENLDELGLDAASFDVIISNCVINLSPDKEAVLRQVHRLLKPGGEMYFADVYADRRLADDIRSDEALYGECLAGAMYWNDFLELAASCGFRDPRLVADRPIRVANRDMLDKLAGAGFYSATYRLFKLADLDGDCEDYGQAVIYRGTMTECPAEFRLDKHHRIARGKVFPVCRNTYRMLRESRFAPHFEFLGDGKRHYGIFDGCGKSVPFSDQAAEAGCC